MPLTGRALVLLALTALATVRAEAAPVATIPADPMLAEMLAEISEQRFSESVKALQAFTSREVGQPGNAAAATWIHDRFAELPGISVAYQDDKLRNVVATRQGRDAGSSQEYIVGAHYDSAAKTPGAAPGATDNAVGVALLLELARAMGARNFRHTVRFAAWNAEEAGCKGSASYVAGAAAAKADIRLYLNFDSVGRDSTGRGLLDVVASRTAAPVRERMVAANTTYNLGFTLEHDRHKCGSDFSPFHAKGIAWLSVHQDDHAFQHTAEDTADKVTPAFTLAIGKLYLAALVPLAEAMPPTGR